MAPKWVKQVIKEQPIEPFSRQALIMEDVTQHTAVFIYRVGPDESYQSQKKKEKKEKNQHYMLQIHIFSKTSFPPFILSFFFPNNTDQQKL